MTRYTRENTDAIDRKFRETREWRDRIRPAQLRREPLCRHCKASGRIVAAEHVDHVKPARGDRTLQRDFDNLQSLCASCHSSKTKSGNTNRLKGVTADGWPIDPQHIWNQKRELEKELAK